MPPAPTLQARIQHDLQSRIVSGEWPPGFRLPVEHELMAAYGCARMTVNKAVAALAGAGLVERRRKAGSFVAPRRIESAVLHIPDIPAAIAARGQAYGYALLSRRRRPAPPSDPAFPPGTQVLHLACRHAADAIPLMLETRRIGLEAVPAARTADFAATPPGTWLLAHVPWTEAENRIAARPATPAEAAHLALPPGAACLDIRRRTWRAGHTITDVRQLFRGDAWHLVARFSPGA